LLPLQEYLLARIDRERLDPLNRQLYRALRDAIQTGLLGKGQALPASRELAKVLALGRNTVLHAYEQLTAEGFLAARQGSATLVAFEADAAPMGIKADRQPAVAAALSARAQAVLSGTGRRDVPEVAAFMPGLPDLAAFPWPVWQRLLQRRQRAASPHDAAYLHAGGHPALKEALAAYLRLSRGVNCDAAQILVTGGMQQTLQLIALALADAGDCAWVEEPGYPGAKAAWLACDMRVAPVPVDVSGLNWQATSLPGPRLVYITPSQQYPLGAVMPLHRRQALLATAAELGAWVVEDDYDSEFRHHGQPLAALQGLDDHGRVLYLGTFSKVMFPSLRLGYLVAPPSLVDPLRRLQARLFREGDYAVQAALADFMAEGHFAAHVRRMRVVYARRQARLRSILAAELGCELDADWGTDLPGGFALLGGAAGMHVTLRLPVGWDDGVVSRALADIGLAAPALSTYCMGPPPFPGLVLGYAGVDDAGLTLAAVKLARLLRELGPVAHRVPP
jgi:GntR family transcriptional regulator/MocR family aminotransferase